jgi:hypothetical protein
VNIAVSEPFFTITEAGTEAIVGFALLSVTSVSMPGATANFTVPVADVPPTTVVGATVSDDTRTGVTSSVDVA